MTRGSETKSQIRVRLEGVCDQAEELDEGLLLRLDVGGGVVGASCEAALVGDRVGGGKAEGWLRVETISATSFDVYCEGLGQDVVRPTRRDEE